ncbi:MAG: class I SAM-dependent DNA methyltransferase, partial [Bacteroidetes bacterium]
KIVIKEPQIEPLIRKYGGAYEMLNNKWRYCLWLNNVSPQTIKKSIFLISRISACENFRRNSTSQSVHSKLVTPSIFGDIRQPSSDYILFPRVSSHRRKYLPLGYISKNTILADSAYGLPNAELFHFGVLQSVMHNSWMRVIAGKLKSDYRYSSTLVYNNFPWPKEPSEKNKKKVEDKAQKVLDVREEFPESSLADLYDPLTMPPKLVKVHQELDKAVDLCYRPKAFTTENARIEFLFDLYNQYTSVLFKKKKKK